MVDEMSRLGTEVLIYKSGRDRSAIDTSGAFPPRVQLSHQVCKDKWSAFRGLGFVLHSDST